LLLAPAVILVTNQLAAIAPLIGRDAQLTGRVDLWLILPSYIAERPWLGYGFGAFWVADSANVSLIWNAVGWTPPHAHDGWLDALLELGVVGLALLCLQIILTVVNGVRAVVDGTEPNSQYAGDHLHPPRLQHRGKQSGAPGCLVDPLGHWGDGACQDCETAGARCHAGLPLSAAGAAGFTEPRTIIYPRKRQFLPRRGTRQGGIFRPKCSLGLTRRHIREGQAEPAFLHFRTCRSPENRTQVVLLGRLPI